MFDYYCNPELGLLPPEQSQLITGLQLTAQIRAKGKDVPSALLQPIFRCLHQIRVSSSTSPGDEAKGQDLVALFKNASTVADAGSVVANMLRNKISRLVGISTADVDANSQLERYGVDSLVALELRNWLSKELSADLAVFEILGGVTLLDIGKTVAQRSPLR